MSQPQPMPIAEAVPVPAPIAKPLVRILSVRIKLPDDGFVSMATPMFKGQSVDDAVRAVLTRFNYDPDQFRGWKLVNGSPNTVAVEVS